MVGVVRAAAVGSWEGRVGAETVDRGVVGFGTVWGVVGWRGVVGGFVIVGLVVGGSGGGVGEGMLVGWHMDGWW